MKNEKFLCDAEKEEHAQTAKIWIVSKIDLFQNGLEKLRFLPREKDGEGNKKESWWSELT